MARPWPMDGWGDYGPPVGVMGSVTFGGKLENANSPNAHHDMIMIMRKPAKPWKRSRWHCRKCGVHTGREYYMLRDELWQGVIERWKIPADEYGQIGMLCVACFEQLLGRRLTKQDFIDCELNRLDSRCTIKSDRLCDRLRDEA